jgi:hypothetical protein
MGNWDRKLYSALVTAAPVVAAPSLTVAAASASASSGRTVVAMVRAFISSDISARAHSESKTTQPSAALPTNHSWSPTFTVVIPSLTLNDTASGWASLSVVRCPCSTSNVSGVPDCSIFDMVWNLIILRLRNLGLFKVFVKFSELPKTKTLF